MAEVKSGIVLDRDLYFQTQNIQGTVFMAARRAYQQQKATETGDETAPPPNPLFSVRAGYAESPGWMLAQVIEFDPEPVTVDGLRRRAIWSAPGIIGAMLELLASEKWLDRRGDSYTFTDAGREVAAQRRERMILSFVNFQPIPARDIEQVKSLLGRIIESGLSADDPPGTWCLDHSRNRAPAADASPLAHIIHYFSDLNALRDDAHMAAIRPFGLWGRTWEAFSYVDDGSADSAAGLFDQLAYRGWAHEDWAQSLAELVDRGWLVEQAGAFASTEDGKAARAEAEQRTDAYFYAPWNCLSAEEFAELWGLLKRMEDAANALLQ